MSSSEPRWGVWCVEDQGWCMTGTHEEAQLAFPEWASGRAAAVDPAHYHYKMLPINSSTGKPVGWTFPVTREDWKAAKEMLSLDEASGLARKNRTCS